MSIPVFLKSFLSKGEAGTSGIDFHQFMNVSKTWMTIFGPKAHSLENWSQLSKAPPDGRAEIENVKCATGDIFNVNSATKRCFRTLTFFPIYGALLKSIIQVFIYFVHVVKLNFDSMYSRYISMLKNFHRVFWMIFSLITYKGSGRLLPGGGLRIPHTCC